MNDFASNQLKQAEATQKLDKALAALVAGVPAEADTILVPLPGLEWESFANSGPEALWRAVQCSSGRAIQIKTTGEFHFGFHSHNHPLDEQLTVQKGACLFGTGRGRYMKQGDVEYVSAEKPHYLRMLEEGIVHVWWPHLTEDKIELVT